jgi:hypothetical protein
MARGGSAGGGAVSAPIYSWESACIDDYKPLEDTQGWLQCPNCSEFPRTWVFDNGNYAKCRCSRKYEGADVSAETVFNACGKRGVPYREYQDFLRVAWNAHCAALGVEPNG